MAEFVIPVMTMVASFLIAFAITLGILLAVLCVLAIASTLDEPSNNDQQEAILYIKVLRGVDTEAHQVIDMASKLYLNQVRQVLRERKLPYGKEKRR